MADKADAAAPGGIPAIRTFQFDATSIGQLATAVNLFRGDVNIPQSLFSLPGRQAGDGMDVTLTLLYQSNVARAATTWNRDAPTSVVGLGWDLPLTYIEATSTGAPDPQTRSYVYYDNGTPNQLIQQPQPHALFAVAEATVSGLTSGARVTTALVAAFLAAGLSLDPASTASEGDGTWTIDDAAHQQQFVIAPPDANGECVVAYGGLAYQLQSYEFWQIAYFPAYERWLLVTDDGLRRSFGGVEPDTPEGYRTAAGNSIAWDVWWGSGGATAMFTGPSTVTAPQLQVAGSWYLTSTANAWGDEVRYRYNDVERDASGLLPGFEQQVGAGGLPFTKQVLLSRVIDVFGRTATLEYADKAWSASGPREYADPHKSTPDSEPNAYQDRYETQYLTAIAVATAGGSPLLGVQLEYLPSPGGVEPALANVAASDDPAYDDLYKRYLTAIRLTNAAGEALPGYDYTYNLDPNGPQPGALAAVTAPQGGSVAYEYTRSELEVCDRTQKVVRPEDQAPNGVPSVFYGDDYAVTLWCDAFAGVLTLQTYTWDGRWISWQLGEDPVLYKGSLDGSTIDVVANANFFAVAFSTGSESLCFAFSKDTARPGQFVPATVGDTTTAPNVPTITYPTRVIDLVGGDTFLAIAAMEQSTTTYRYDVLTWRWTTASWTLATTEPDVYTWLAACGEYLLTLSASGAVSLAWLDGALAWSSSPTSADLTKFGFSVPQSNVANVVLAADTATVVVNTLLSGNVTQHTYKPYILQWDAAHRLSVSTADEVKEPQPLSGGPLPWVPVIVANCLIAVNGTLLRYDGQRWAPNPSSSFTSPSQPPAPPRFAYGPDYALMATSPNQQGLLTKVAVAGYDPDDGGWRTPQTYALPAAQRSWDNWPAAGNADYAAVGPQLYFRGTATDWTTVPANSDNVTQISVSDGGTFDSQSLVNEGPAFLAFASLAQSGGSSSAQAVVLQNGGPEPTEAIVGQRIYTPSIADTVPTPGSAAQGPSMFVGYDADAGSFRQAGTIYLNCYAGAALTGPVVHWPVTAVTVDDGFQQPVTTTYAPDPGTARCDPTGLVVKYYTTAVYPGSDRSDASSNPVAGCKQTTYVNSEDVDAADYYEMLDGLLASTVVYDSASAPLIGKPPRGKPLETHTNSWSVIQQVASDPTNPAAAPIRLHGGWVQHDEQTSTVDGVTATTAMTYTDLGMPGPFSGQAVSQQRTSIEGPDAAITFSKTMTYGPEVNATMRALNMRTPVVQTITRAQPYGAEPVVVASSASTMTQWPNAAGTQVPAVEGRFWLRGDVDAAFPFAGYAAGDTPAGWLLDQRVTARTPVGQTAESVDACGTATTSLFSADLALPVAEIANAALGAAAYLGFEPYEDRRAWQLDPTALVSGRARTGTTALRLPGGAGTGASLSIALPAVSGTYVAGLWYRADGAAPQITAAAGTEQPVTSRLEPASGDWKVATVGIPATADATTSTPLTVTVTNPSDVEILLDAVWVVPLAGGMVARTYDATTRLMTSAIDSGGRTRWTLYDAFNRRALQLGLDGQPTELAGRFLSRQGNAGQAFDESVPNAELTVHAAGSGSAQVFSDLSDWQTTWTAGDATDWKATAAGLTNVAAGDATLAYAGGTLPATWALAFQVEGPAQGPVRLQAGGVSITYGPGGYSGWGSVMTPAGAPPRMAGQWLLVAGDRVVLFFGDGQLLFSTTQAADIAHIAAPVITAAPGVRVSQLALLGEPRVSLAYHDGCGRRRQAHRLYGADSRVCERLHDTLGRTVAVTRTAPGSFGSGAGRPVLAYRPGFVDATAFATALSADRQMTGDVADYYRGQIEHGVARSDDGGYPYYGTRWEDSPRRRKLEIGNPGQAYAITDIATTSPADRATTQFAYGANSSSDPELARMTITTPVKTTATRLTDKVGLSIAGMQADATGAPVAKAAAQRTYSATADGPQTSTTVRMPNALPPSSQPDMAAYVTTAVADALGRSLSRADVDTGETQFIYDQCGRVRFVQGAQDVGDAPSFAYTRYDVAGRIVEQGTVAMAWDPATLAPLAEQLDWPTSAVAHTVAVAFTYDGDGSDPTQIGKKVACTTITPPPSGGTACVVDETFTYDRSARLVGATVTVSGPQASSAHTAYAYNALGEIVEITYPEDAPVGSVQYTLDDQGQITAIASDDGAAAAIASYTYTADGAVDTETLGGGAWVRRIAYDSPGWPLSIAATGPDGESLAIDYTYNDDGSVATRSVDLAFPGATETLTDTYAYDGSRRLLTAAGSSGDARMSYDPNGNILAVTTEAGTDAFVQAPGTDQLSEVTIGQTTTDVAYDARGRVTSALGRTLSYDDATNLMVAASGSGRTVQIGYDSRRQRVVKTVAGDESASTLYVSAPGGNPLARRDDGTWTALVHGPTGLTAACGETVRFPLKDMLQSVWAVVDAAGDLAGYTAYLPFGAQTRPLDAFPYAFMGQEWDAELALYAFGDRMYDPSLSRFLAPDPARQYASPYAFCGNDPLNTVDPTGDLGVGGRVGVGIAMAVVLVIGIAASIATGGAAAPEVVATESTLGTTETVVDASEPVLNTAETTLDSTGAPPEGDVTPPSGNANSVRVGSGGAPSNASMRLTTTMASKVAANVGNLAVQSGIGAIQSAALSGLQYDIQNGRTFTAAGFFEAMGFGALSGAIGGGIGGIPGMPALSTAMNDLPKLVQVGINVTVQTIAGVAGSEVTQVISNVVQTGPDRPPWYAGMLQTLWISGVESFAIAGFTSGVNTYKPEIKAFGETLPGKATSAMETIQASARAQANQAQVMVNRCINVGGEAVAAVSVGTQWLSRSSVGPLSTLLR